MPCMSEIFQLNKSSLWSEPDLKEVIGKRCFFWVDLTSPSLPDVKILEKLLDIHPLTSEDIINKKTRVKIERFDKYLFMVFYGAVHAAGTIRYHEIEFILGKNFLVTTHMVPLPSFEDLKKDRAQLAALMKKGGDYLMHSLLDGEVDNYIPAIDSLDFKIEDIEARIFTNPHPALINEIMKVKRTLIGAKRIVFPLKEEILKIYKWNDPFISKEAVVYYRDTYDHLIRLSDAIEMHRDLVSGVLEYYLSMMGNKLNDIMRVLTVIATIILPLTLISSIYGMNFDHMPELHWAYGYPFALVLMLIIAVWMLIYFKRKKWI